MPDDNSMLGQNLVDVRNEARRARQQPETLFNAPVALRPRQQLVYEAAALQPLTALAAGILLHTASDCCHCTEDQPCQYADRHGREVLEALRKKNLLRHDKHRVYRRTDGLTADRVAGGYDPSTAPIPF